MDAESLQAVRALSSSRPTHSQEALAAAELLVKQGDGGPASQRRHALRLVLQWASGLLVAGLKAAQAAESPTQPPSALLNGRVWEVRSVLVIL